MINAELTGFDWDEHSTDKNRNKHGVEPMECEEVFFHQPLVGRPDLKHSEVVPRFHVLGQTDKGRLLLLVYTVRGQKIRIISARDMSRKPIPKFADEAEEALFWQTHDSTDYVDWSMAKPVTFANLQPSLKSISLRLPEPMLARLKSLANERDVPYQSLIKMILADHLAHS